jgi:hypothetical protein
MIRGRTLKAVAIFLTANMVNMIVCPTASYALTGGPSQPEVESFEPVTTNQMVDLFSGDFNYNIPLLTVPGPNGGYPINIAYHAGIGMEQEASWVGLGWNINPGVVNRNLRGLPDDFNGDVVEREMNMKTNYTLSFSRNTPSQEALNLSLKTEKWGFDSRIGQQMQVYVNNYKGLGFRYSLSKQNQQSVALSDKDQLSVSGNWSLSFDSQSGIGFSPSLSFGKFLTDKTEIFSDGFVGGSLNAAFHSRQGIQGLGMTFDVNKSSSSIFKKKGNYTYGNSRGGSIIGGGAGMNFSSVPYVPAVYAPILGANANFTVLPGTTESNGDYDAIAGWDVAISKQFLLNRTYDMEAYGYLYSQNRDDDIQEPKIMDFNREKDIAVTKRTPSLPIPVATHDVYTIKGQGVGGMFRPFRNDIGIYHDEAATSASIGYTIMNAPHEIAPGPAGSKVGIVPSASVSGSYSGKWQSMAGNVDAYNFGQEHTDNVPDALYEHFYFKSNGEQTASELTEMSAINGDQPVRFEISRRYAGVSLKPYVHNRIKNASPYNAGYNQKTTRAKRMQSIQHRTNAQITDHENYSSRANHLYTENKYPTIDATNGEDQYDYDDHSDDHIGEVAVTNPDGSSYIYGIPAYNFERHDVAFAITPGDENIADKYETPRFATYTTTGSADNSVDNDNGEDNFYTRTTMPEYAHSYLLTSVVSPNYVDLKNDGPSADDLGYWTKFNYTKVHGESAPYLWRAPFEEANYTKGYYSNELDDRGSYTYGSKEVYYTNSIETKTHIAVFELEDRADGHGVSIEDQVGGVSPSALGKKLKRLSKIKLYSKEDITTPIKTVHFEYDYSLCEGIPNTSKTAPEKTGKLTLKKIWFTYLDNEKGSLSPYEFAYGDANHDKATDDASNENYDLLAMDRWGNYHPDDDGETKTFRLNSENPFVVQGDYNGDDDIDVDDEDDRTTHAFMWNLSTIQLPSGGIIEIDYESDDYSHVQDKRAMQMCRIVGTSTTSSTEMDTDADDGLLRKGHRRIYFKLEEPIPVVTPTPIDPPEVLAYIEGINDLYFKTWQNLKNEFATTDMAKDYVKGYCGIKTTSGTYGFDTKTSNQVTYDSEICYQYAYFEVEPASYKGGTTSIHPFRKAGWQYIRYSRPDLFNQGGDLSNDLIPNLTNIITAFNLVTDAFSMVFGYYNVANIKGYCKSMDIDEKPSYVRLNSPDYIKKGGGHRVSKIAIKDNWSSVEGSDAVYGQTYNYRMPDGMSSGVADYEPLIGGEEIPHHQPVWYNGSDQTISFQHQDAFIEKPYGESYFPGPSVGYRRVEVKSIEYSGTGSNAVAKSGSGVSVSEFYTSKDFPVFVDKTELLTKPYNVPIVIPFIGSQSFHNNGYSQGYVVELNDMHGKPKSGATYPNGTDFTTDPTPVNKVEYFYNTNSNNAKRLDNEVTVLDNDGYYRPALLGQTHDFFIAMSEHSSFSLNAGGQINLQIAPTAGVIPTAMPLFEYSESMYRDVVTNKVIYKTGILQKVQNYKDGAYATAENEMFDAETGQPLLTKTINEHEKPVYSYSYAAHWAYEGMQGEYQNIGATYKNLDFTAGVSGTIADPEKYLNIGDEVEVQTSAGGTIKTYWISAISSGATGSITLEKADGTSAGTISGTTPWPKVKVVKSFHRNQQSVSNGSIVSLSNPVTDRDFPILTAFNAAVPSFPAGGPYTYNFTDCETGTQYSTTVTANLTENKLEFTASGCGIEITFPGTVTLTATSPEDWNLAKRGNIILARNLSTSEEYICELNNECGLMECLDDVLHADASEFAHEGWTYNYNDIGDPDIDNGTITGSIATTAANDFAFGKEGIWRAVTSFAYQIDRKQTSTTNNFKTRINTDGTYDNFTLFDWSDNPAATNDNWTQTSTVTKYSPYGYALESKNALEIYGSELYGYNHSTVTATAANARYLEMGYDGFEDHGSTYQSDGFGHFKFVSNTGTPVLNNTYAHTGEYSLGVYPTGYVEYEINTITPASDDYLELQPDQTYNISTWVYVGNGGEGTITVTYDGSPLSPAASFTTLNSDEPIIDGWKRLEGKFKVPTGGTGDLKIKFTSTDPLSLPVPFDDIRIHPFKGAMATYVYNPETLWLLAELDNRNFATFYNYDEEGALIQVKKETAKGIVTISRNQQNTVQTP